MATHLGRARSKEAKVKVYLAAPFALNIVVNALAGELRRAGFPITSRWHDPKFGHGKNFAVDYSDQGRDGMSKEANEDLSDIRDADVLIAFTQPPKTSYTSGGRHVEFGYALALGKKILVCGPVENVFVNLADGVYGTWGELVNALKSLPTATQ